MLMLTNREVTYCQVAATIEGVVKNKAGIIYNQKIFIKVKSYNLDELEVAVKDYRENFLDNEKVQVPTIIVKGEDSVNIWAQDSRYRPTENSVTNQFSPSTSPVETNKSDILDVKSLINQMRGENGLKIKTRRYKLKLYHHCFLGNEAVDWLVDYFKVSRQEAIIIGQRLIDKKVIHHVVDEHYFKDESLFYRFYEDEDKSIWNGEL